MYLPDGSGAGSRPSTAFFAAVSASARLYRDTWAIFGQTYELDAERYMFPWLRLLVRAPLKAMRDVEYPMRGPDRLDISRADAVLHDAATIWIVDNLELYEGDTRLGSPRLAAVRARVRPGRHRSIERCGGKALPRPGR